MDTENLGVNLLRVPRKVRLENGLQLDDFLCLRNRMGTATVLRIAKPLRETYITMKIVPM